MQRDPGEDGVDGGRWTQWRGRNGSGIAPAGSPPIHFSDTEGYRWKTPLPGLGHSSPVVWDDLIFLTVQSESGDPPDVAIVCLDRRDGRIVWRADVGQARGRTHAKNGYASASVATDGERLFASFLPLGLFCYDLSGHKLWSIDFDQKDHTWGLASSPVLFGDAVIQLYDYDGDSFVAAYDKKTGERLWLTPRASVGSWSTPVFVEAIVGGQPRTEMIVSGGDGLQRIIAYDPVDGRELWRAGETTQWVTPLPLVGNGLVYCASGRNGPILAIEPGGSGDVTATHIVWKTARGGPYIPSGVCYRNRLYLLGDGGALCCYDAGDGRSIWDKRLGSEHFTSSLIAADGRIYAVSEQGTVYVVAAGDAFDLLATNQMHSPCLATPAVADGDLFLRTKNDLYCFPGQAPVQEKLPSPASGTAAVPLAGEGTSTWTTASVQAVPVASQNAWPLFRGDAQATGVAVGGLPGELEPLWTFAADQGGFEATAAIIDGVVYLGSTGGKFFAIDLATGEKRWEHSTPLGFSASAAVRDGRVYVGDSDGVFYCLDATSGKPLWSFPTDGQINSSANFHGDRVLFGSQDGFLYCLEASGKLAWKFESPDQIRCFPTVVDNTGFVAGCDGKLHVIDLEQGKELRTAPIDSPTGCSPAVRDGIVFVGTEGHSLFAIDPRQGKIMWRYEPSDRGASIRSSAAVTPEAVLVGARDKQLHAIESKTGNKLWTFATKGRVDSSPVVVGDRVFFGSSDGRLYCVDVKSGQSTWQFELGGAVVASPAVAEERLVIGNDAGELYCFGRRTDQ